MTSKRKSWGFPRWGDYGVDSDPVFVRTCDYDGCTEKADHPAPKAPRSSDRWWFCQTHAAEYNRNWNFFTGMSADEARAFQEEEDRKASGYSQASPWSWGGSADDSGFNRAERDALAVLELDTDASARDIKSQFRKLAKKYHPDANGGDAAAQDKFHRIRAAYEVLRERADASA